ncbi:ATP-dependent DNA helicase [Calidifontibacter sp. DB0510]|uniref:ATP-dependent helicase DinG n=1 Tax=Metallococcus carri TaxID=1656884 RepID=A0A967EEX5_9MICO|nr:ATP-dependent DNA helicase [Metallococcus carri]NHN56086.1 ATP-dependent DNA helicase [Metallococcus carri]NOP37457.1 ATP-dependent DNA helicase [Calidifontibacter sp. DB2511S]
MPPTLDALLDAAVGGVGGSPRPGQQRMAHAVAEAVERKRHLLVQAGTGTGKSLAYLVPAIAHAQATGKPVVVATATLALQAQIVDRDLPRIADALAPLLQRRPTFGLVKGRRNYLCKHKLLGGYPDDDGDTLLGVGEVDQQLGRLEREVVRLREWAEETDSGDRDTLVPGVSERAWRQVSVSAKECLGSRCPLASECFVEQSRAEAADVDVVVTNHSFMAIDAFEGRQMLPEHDLLIVDEAHELVDRITSTITDELTPGLVAAAARAAARLADTDALAAAGTVLEQALQPLKEGRLLGVPDTLALAVQQVHDAAREVSTEIKPANAQDNDGARQRARAAVDEVFDTSARLLEDREVDVAWISQDPRRGPVVRVAPMTVAMLVRDKIFEGRSVVLTSATLELGGTFDAVAGTIGLRGDGAPPWDGLDVGSPFDYPGQAIAYVARHLPPPGRDGTAEETMAEIEQLIRAAGGRTLGLFSSMRAATAAAEAMRDRLGDEYPVLCQGEDRTPTLVREFAADARTCLFGTLSLWQGVDVPGSACQLVLIDRIPFPRPDDPISSARSQAIAERGGNGFMAVSATHAALRLAQGAGRLIRRGDDRGVVAFLDSRLMTARYAGFLQRSLPPFWPTTDRALVLGALRRLDQIAPDPLPVSGPGERVVAATTASTTAIAAPTRTATDRLAAQAATISASSDTAYGTVVEDPDEPVQHPAPVEPSLGLASDPPGEVGEVGGEQADAGAEPTDAGAEPIDAGAEPANWSDEDDEELRDGHSLGLDADELAEHLDRPVEQVRARLDQLGVS